MARTVVRYGTRGVSRDQESGLIWNSVGSRAGDRWALRRSAMWLTRAEVLQADESRDMA